jgi:AraC family transcriptional regulator, alkane utilization regulator
VSRSVLAERFTQTVGEPPMRYLTQSRMQLARELLRQRRRSIPQIAVDVGYEAEAAFNRAFKREVGIPPAAWRDTHA